MDEEKNKASYESFGEVVEEYGDVREHDMLTDPDAVAAAGDKHRAEQAISHGQKLRAVRELRGFTLEELSKKTGIEPEVLGLLESGEAYLPLGQVIRLSKALSMRMSDVISTGEEPFTVVRSGERKSFVRFGKSKQASHGYEYESLAPDKKDRVMEPFIVTLHPAAGDQPSSHDGQEFIYVLDGEMEVVIDDFREVLGPGDAVYYDSTSMHLVKAYGDKPAKILAVLVS
jgi:quercetin dioxygenase-like cupin family protein